MKRTFVYRVFIALGVASYLATSMSSVNVFAAPAQREFTTVAAKSPLYAHLEEIRHVGWTGLGMDEEQPSTSAVSSGLTRYEMALETAKAIFTIQARQRADADWSKKAKPQSLRALRALSLDLRSELTRLEIKVDAAVLLLDQLLRPQTLGLSSSPSSKQSAKTSLNFSTSPDFPSSISATPTGEISLPLSQRLRVYGALSSLLREKNGYFQSGANAITSDIFRLRSPEGKAKNLDVKIGTSLDVTHRLRLRAGLEQRNSENFFIATTAFFQSVPDSERSIGSGLDFKLLPGVILTGNVARVKGFELNPTTNGVIVNGTRYEGGIGLSGWQNRVALSAHLAHLVPEDASAFGTTAAQLNLGVEVTQQVQLKLLFRQMFDTPQNSGSMRLISGGININF